MTIETKQLERAFRYNSVTLPDPGPSYGIEQVRDMYAAAYPDITTAAIEGPEEKDGKLVYTFRRAVGTKGARRLSAKQKAWCKAYENATTFEPLMDDFLANNESFARAAEKSRDWFESWMNEAFRGIPDIPGERP